MKFFANSPIYSFATENLHYLHHFDLINKRVLCTTSSLDCALNAAFLRARQIDNFDLNPLASHWAQLKLAALLALDYKQYLSYLMRGPRALERSTYEKLAPTLRAKWPEAHEYWQHLYERCGPSAHEIRESQLFNNRFDTQSEKIKNNPYLQSQDNYHLTQKRISELLESNALTFLTQNILSLPQALAPNTKYDIMVLSNIWEYSHQMFGLDHLREFRDKIIYPLLSFLEPNGHMMLGYIFASESASSITRNPIAAHTMRLTLYGQNLRYTYREFALPSSIEGCVDVCCALTPATQCGVFQ